MTRFLSLMITTLLLLTGLTVAAQETPAAPTDENTTPAPAENTAYLRVANFSPDTEAVSVALDDSQSGFDSLSYKQISDWVAVPAGEHSLSFTDAADGAASEPATVELAANTWTTAAVVNAVDDDTPTVQTFQEEYSELIPGTAGFTVVNAVEGMPSLNLLRDNIVYMTGLDYLPQTQTTTSLILDSGTFDIALVEPETPETNVIDLSQTEIPENGYTLIAIVGTPDNPETVIDTTDASEVAMVTGQLESPGTILEAAQADENLTDLAEDLSQTGVLDELNGDEGYTVFAPANFALDNVDSSDPQALSDLLRHHIVEGKLTSQDIFNADSVTALDGSELMITHEGNNVYVNDAQIIAVNIPASNGVIHMINGVLQPAG